MLGRADQAVPFLSGLLEYLEPRRSMLEPPESYCRLEPGAWKQGSAWRQRLDSMRHSQVVAQR